MRYSPVKVKIIQRGLTILDLIEKRGLPKSLTYMTLRGERHSRRVQEEIAEELGEDAATLWGDTFWLHFDGERRAS